MNLWYRNRDSPARSPPEDARKAEDTGNAMFRSKKCIDIHTFIYLNYSCDDARWITSANQRGNRGSPRGRPCKSS